MSFINAEIVSVGVNPQDYHAEAGERGEGAFCMSPSALKEFDRCPARWVAGYRSPDSKAKKWGNLVDTLLLTPELFRDRYAVQPKTYEDTGMQCPKCLTVTDSKTCRKCALTRIETTVEKPWNGNADYCRRWAEVHQGRDLISATDEADAEAAVKVIRSDAIMSSYIDDSDKQVLVKGLWKDEGTGVVVPVRCLIDLAPRIGTKFANTLGDLKTDSCAAVLPFQRKAHRYGYHLQAAFDLDLFNAATGEARHDWCLLVQENFPPFQVGRRYMAGADPETGFIMLGRATYQKALHNYCACLKSGKWPSYDDTDEASDDGWTPMYPEPWMDNEQTFAPRFQFEEGDEAPVEDEELEPVNLN